MPHPKVCSAVGRKILKQLHTELEREGRGSMRRISRELGLKEDYIATKISRGVMDVGTFFSVLDRLQLSPQVFLLGLEIPSTKEMPDTDLPVVQQITDRWQSEGPEKDD